LKHETEIQQLISARSLQQKKFYALPISTSDNTNKTLRHEVFSILITQ